MCNTEQVLQSSGEHHNVLKNYNNETRYKPMMDFHSGGLILKEFLFLRFLRVYFYWGRGLLWEFYGNIF